jgi:uncharacterized protein YbjT (DUF2867 family)
METTAMTDSQPVSSVLVVGATGALGGRVVAELVSRRISVRALVRAGSDATRLAEQGAEVVRGDLVDPASLEPALDGVDALVTTAAGYVRRRKGDSLATVDDRGNRNLVDAARNAGLRRFVFTSILTCDKAPDVPHFWQKKLIEDYLDTSGVPFVALRPGAFIGVWDYWKRGLRKGRLMALGSASVRWTNVHVDDVARYLALAVDRPGTDGRRIDIGMDRAVSTNDLAAVFTQILGRDVTARGMPWPLLSFVARPVGVLSERVADMRAMIEYFHTGQYVADTSAQAEIFGDVPTVEDTLRRYATDAGLLATAR